MKAFSFLFFLSVMSCSTPQMQPSDILHSKDGKYRQCYEESDSIKDTLVLGTGTVKISFTVLPDGKIDDEKILESEFKDPNFHACLLDITRGLKFGPQDQEGGKKVTKILNFKTQIKMNE